MSEGDSLEKYQNCEHVDNIKPVLGQWLVEQTDLDTSDGQVVMLDDSQYELLLADQEYIRRARMLNEITSRHFRDMTAHQLGWDSKEFTWRNFPYEDLLLSQIVSAQVSGIRVGVTDQTLVRRLSAIHANYKQDKNIVIGMLN